MLELNWSFLPACYPSQCSVGTWGRKVTKGLPQLYQFAKYQFARQEVLTGIRGTIVVGPLCGNQLTSGGI